jgi:acetolactate synthase-1/2/3 large subunit
MLVFHHLAVERIVTSLLEAKNPLIITSYLGRNPAAVPKLIQLVDLLALPVFSSCLSHVNIPFDHISHVGLSFGQPNPLVSEADFLLMIDTDIPYIPLKTQPSPTCKIFHIDCDPLKDRMSFFAYPAELRARADAELALEQIFDVVHSRAASLDQSLIGTRRTALETKKKAHLKDLKALEVSAPNDIMTAPLIVSSLRTKAPENTLILNEAISNYPIVWEHFAPKLPGSLLSSGASSLGWALGAAVGAHLAGEAFSQHKKDLVAVVVGDGSFIFGVPSASYWMARRYETPYLTIVLNNGGWKSPRLSMLGVHPEGLGSKASAKDLNISFGPDNPDYGAIAAAAGGAWFKKVMKASELDAAMTEAINVVMKEKRCALLDCWLERF